MSPAIEGLRVTVARDEAFDAVRAIGHEEMANKIEQIVYSCADGTELIHDLYDLVQSARRPPGAVVSYRINPDDVCTQDGCTRPKATGENVCSQCSRLARAVGAEIARDISPEPSMDTIAKPPRCVVYLSRSGDVMTMELTGEPKFTEKDVEAVAAALRNRRS